MKKHKKAIIISLIFLILLILLILFIAITVITKIKKNDISNTDSYNGNNKKLMASIIEKKDTDEIEKAIEDGKKVKIGEAEVGKNELSIQQDTLNNVSFITKAFLKKSDNPVIEMIKKEVEIQEAEKLNITLPDEEKEHYRETAEGMYEKSDKTMEKDEYIEKWKDYLITEEIAQIYMSRIENKIENKEIDCPDKKVKKAFNELYKSIDKHSISSTGSKLSNAFNEYLLYLCKNYTIEY